MTFRLEIDKVFEASEPAGWQVPMLFVLPESGRRALLSLSEWLTYEAVWIRDGARRPLSDQQEAIIEQTISALMEQEHVNRITEQLALLVDAVNNLDAGGGGSAPDYQTQLNDMATTMKAMLRKMCCVVGDMPDIPEPPDIPDVPEPPPDLTLEELYCRTARAVAMNLRHVLTSLAELCALNTLNLSSVANVLRRAGLEDGPTIYFVSVSVFAISLVSQLLEDLIYFFTGVRHSVAQKLTDVANAITDDAFTCEFVAAASTGAGAQSLAEIAKDAIDDILAGENVVIREFVKSLVWSDKIANFLSSTFIDEDGDTVTIDMSFISHEDCCAPQLPDDGTFLVVPLLENSRYRQSGIEVSRLGRLRFRGTCVQAGSWKEGEVSATAADVNEVYPPSEFAVIAFWMRGVGRTLSDPLIRHVSPSGGTTSTAYSNELIIHRANNAYGSAFASSQMPQSLANVLGVAGYTIHQSISSMTSYSLTIRQDAPAQVSEYVEYDFGLVLRRL